MKHAYILRRRKLGRTSCREIKEFSKNILGVFRNDKEPPNAPDLVCIRWGCTSNVVQKNVFNTAGAIHEVGYKKYFRMKLAKAGLAPRTWSGVDDFSDSWYDEDLENSGPDKYVVRPSVHAQGKDVLVGQSLYAIIEHSEYLNNDCYISEFIDKVAEYRVFVAQGRVVWVAQKTPGNPEDVAWNVARGGRFDNVRWNDWPLKAVKTSIEAFNLSELDFGGVDVMVDKEGKCYVLEINSAPSQTSPYRQECVAKAFDFMLENGKERIPLVEKPGGYLKFIHPALDKGAKVV